jgi:hypothetical protein
VTVSAVLTNTSNVDVAGPIWVILNRLANDAGLDATNATGKTSSGFTYFEVLPPDGTLAAGASLPLLNIVFTNPLNVAIDARYVTVARPVANEIPLFNGPTPTGQVVAGRPFTFTASATDPDSTEDVTFVLARGPAGAVLDPTTGLLSWLPQPSQRGVATFEIRAYDSRGGFGRLVFGLQVGIEGGTSRRFFSRSGT